MVAWKPPVPRENTKPLSPPLKSGLKPLKASGKKKTEVASDLTWSLNIIISHEGESKYVLKLK
jgi:hypothetical protein